MSRITNRVTKRPTNATALLLLALLGLGAQACHGKDRGGAAASAARPPAPVKVEAVHRGAIDLTLRYPGELKAPETVQIAPEVSGRIEAVSVRMGDKVKKGQLLVRLDDAQLRSQLQESRAALQVARSNVQRAKVEDRTTATELKRKASLAKRDLITRQEMDNIRSRRDTAAASLAVATAQVTQASARIGLLTKQLRDTRIRAPFSGWIQARSLDPGAVASAGTAVLKLVRKSPVVVQFKVGERHIGEVRRRMAAGPLPVQVSVDAYPRKPFSGQVVRVSPALDSASRTAAVEAELPNEDGRLMPGMFCRVALDLGASERALLVPLRALLDETPATRAATQRGRAAQVFVVEAGKARRVTFQLGTEDNRGGEAGGGGVGEVLGGLEQGQQVVVEGQADLEDGAAVKVMGAPGVKR